MHLCTAHSICYTVSAPGMYGLFGGISSLPRLIVTATEYNAKRKVKVVY